MGALIPLRPLELVADPACSQVASSATVSSRTTSSSSREPAPVSRSVSSPSASPSSTTPPARPSSRSRSSGSRPPRPSVTVASRSVALCYHPCARDRLLTFALLHSDLGREERVRGCQEDQGLNAWLTWGCRLGVPMLGAVRCKDGAFRNTSGTRVVVH